MQYSIGDLPHLVRTPLGRQRVLAGLLQGAYPVLRRLAGLHRRTLARRVRLIAVVGSYGKTTTARAVAASLRLRPNPNLAFNSHSSLAWNLLHVRPRDSHAVLEVGISGPGQMSPYAAMIRPQVVVVTSIGTEHNRSFKTLTATREEKSTIVRALPADGIAVLNGDDPNVLWMADQTRARVVTYGVGDHNHIRGSHVTMDWPNGSLFRVECNGTARSVRTRLLGQHSIASILAAIAVNWAEGKGIDEAITALEQLRPMTGRMEIVPLRNQAILIRDDFKSSLETIHRALETLGEVPAKRRVVVLGDVSEPPGTPATVYGGVGEKLARIADLAIFVGQQHRRYAAGAVRAGMKREAMVSAGREVLPAAAMIREMIQPGDVVLVKGRDTQRLDRISLALAGRTVRCDVLTCSSKLGTCATCPMLEPGWGDHEVIV